MSVNTKEASQDDISREIIKAFAKLGKCKRKYPNAADILQFLNIGKIIENVQGKKYRSIYYSDVALVKLILFMNIIGIWNQSYIERFLKKHKRERKKLGLKRVPDQTMISKFKNHYLTDETKEILNHVRDKIIQIAKDFDIDLDQKQKAVKKPYLSAKQYRLDRETRKAVKLLKKLLIDSKLIRIRHNSIYNLREYLNLLIKMMMQNTYAETGSRQFRRDLKKQMRVCIKCGKSLLYPLSEKVKKDWALNYLHCPECGHRERISPHGETLLYHISSKFENIESLMKHFETLFEKIWFRTQAYNLFDEPVNISIDRTEIPFYGDINADGVEGKKPEKGTEFGYIIYTVYVSKSGRRYTLITLPLIKHKQGIPESRYLYNQNLILRSLLTYAKRKVKIKYVLFDKGFFSADVFKIIDDMGLKYLTICRKDKYMVDKTKNLPSHSYISDFKYGNYQFNLFMVRKKISHKNNPRKKKEVIWRYATNARPTGDSREWVDTMAKLYPKRWGIETSYRKMKEDFFPKTTSKKYIIRLFYFELVSLFYNLWIFVNIMVFFSLFDDVKRDPIIHAMDFLQEMYCIGSYG
jgi:DNA-directed RNA polymerase subunit RPC12/RpoP